MSPSGTRSPLPIHSPRPSPRGSPRSSFLSSFSSAPSAVREKVALSYPRSTSSLPAIRPFVLVPLRVGNRSISLPVLRLLAPSPSIRTGPPLMKRILAGFLGSLALCVLTVVLSILVIFPAGSRGRRALSGDPSTLIFTPEQVRRVWEWEIGSGRYPSSRSLVGKYDAKIWDDVLRKGAVNAESEKRIENPGLPRWTAEDERREEQVEVEVRRKLREQGKEEWVGQSRSPPVVSMGNARRYLDIDDDRPATPFPLRPTRDSVLDLDRVMEKCDFELGRYVRDCLEVLRVNAGLDTGVRRGLMNKWAATFVPVIPSSPTPAKDEAKRQLLEAQEKDMTRVLNSTRFYSLLATRQQLSLLPPSTTRHPSHPTADDACDPNYPRIFHIFWAGPFTDKPYAAAMSFLFTQPLGLSRPIGSVPDPTVCRPQLWIWINPGPASSLPDPRAEEKMKRELKENPWSAPLLHPRFEEVVKFRLWNTSEQLDGVAEMKGWREMRLFNSGGVKYGKEVKPKPKPKFKVQRDEVAVLEEGTAMEPIGESDTSEDRVVDAIDNVEGIVKNGTASSTEKAGEGESEEEEEEPAPPRDELFLRVGSSSASGYDRLSVVLSDMARFVLTHRFGGVYLDADNLLLRDWEELWGWHGAFAYRWSRLEKYNTAVLKMQRGSALGNFIFRTAVANGLDFHPMTISRYMKDSGLEGLLLRLPDALFDPAWLNTEYYQRERPPFPYFKRFEDFFQTPAEGGAAPTALGFDGFFKGSFGYHYHNQWWSAFDPSRNFPDLGHRFVATERIARGRLVAAKLAALPHRKTPTLKETTKFGPSPTAPEPLVSGLPTGVAPRQLENPDGSRWGDDESDFDQLDWSDEGVEDDERDLSWSTVFKRTFEAFIRGERPNMYGEWLTWNVEDHRRSANDFYF
ncbi:hypothetical protein T439DRAFT_180554 [Meredithblackwellia eburnea MCA 4105]